MSRNDFLRKILVIIVVYKKEIAQVLAEVMPAALLGQISILIYDNSPLPQELTNDFVIYRHDSTNSGVSKAYNQAATIASDMEKKWLLFLDHDTICTLDYFQEVYHCVQNNPESIIFIPKLRDHLGYLSPFEWRWGRGRRIQQVKEAKYSLEKYRFVNSGLFIANDSFKQVGGYLESIPLDFSDIAFGEKLKSITDYFIVVNATLSHSFSNSESADIETAKSRYYFFCLGAIAYGRTFGNIELYSARALLRGLHLTFRYKTLDFLSLFFKHRR